MGQVAPQSYEANFLIVAQRRTTDDFALVGIDTLDVVAVTCE
jgi:hypothetical protein